MILRGAWYRPYWGLREHKGLTVLKFNGVLWRILKIRETHTAGVDICNVEEYFLGTTMFYAYLPSISLYFTFSFTSGVQRDSCLRGTCSLQ